MSRSRRASFIIVTASYVVATLVGVLVFLAAASWPVLARLGIAEAAATIVIYLISLIVRNASVYDPYWSVAPIVVCVGVVALRPLTVGAVLLVIVVTFWGVRLTANWAATFSNLTHQDWRYDLIQRRHPRLFPLICLVGIMGFPSLVIYLVTAPAVVFLQASGLTWITVVGLIVSLGATTMQLVADRQLRRFRASHAVGSGLIREGLWRHSRHPNYLAEILMWWGVWLVMMSTSPSWWFLAVGPAVNTAMFWFVSIPMADNRNRERHDDYDVYYAQTRALLPFRRGCH
ncbi:MAG: DUF1295 domain-containing protein [Propionibacteriaceae bacterium]|jgi:steroid 5-alpha reductase family enzyme|nr:DUF1295 domain-containing protein [Propionibacteriaceae bacterium]